MKKVTFNFKPISEIVKTKTTNKEPKLNIKNLVPLGSEPKAKKKVIITRKHARKI
jgi:hypothetical protein